MALFKRVSNTEVCINNYKRHVNIYIIHILLNKYLELYKIVYIYIYIYLYYTLCGGYVGGDMLCVEEFRFFHTTPMCKHL